MKNRFDDLWISAASDGASCPVHAVAAGHDAGEDVDLLMDAWYSERAVRIESSLLLEQALRVIANLLAEGGDSTRKQRQARRLLRAIRKSQGGDRRGL